jgi:ABC-type antimicrobial peptide transport system permease subunit
VVAERRREVGVRMALGATANAVRWMVMSQGAKVVVAGLALGVGAAFASTRLLSTLLYNVKAVDPLVFAAMSIVMTAIGMLASYVPARRASKVEPIESLRGD